MADINPDIKGTLSKEEIEKLKELQSEYKQLISSNRYHDRLKEGKRQQNTSERVELYKYNNHLDEFLNKYISDHGSKDMIEVIKEFMDKQLDYEKNKKINVEAFNTGYNAINGQEQINSKDMDTLLNADLPEDLRIGTLDCKATPITCNYKYFLKSFYNLLNKKHKIRLLTDLLKRVKANSEGGKSVNAFVSKSSELSMSEGQVSELLVDKVDIGTLDMTKVVSIFKALKNKDVQKKLKDKFSRDIVNDLRATCYNRLHYYINQDILKLEHTFNTLKNWHMDKKRVTVPKSKKKDSQYNSTRRRSYYLNKEYALLRQTFYNIKPETKKRKKEYYANYKLKIVDKELYRRKNNLRTQIYRLLNKERVNAIIARYNERKNGKRVSRVANI